MERSTYANQTMTDTEQPTALCPSHYPNFHCIGGQCEDSCCIGWRVHLDKTTYHYYKHNQHKALVKLFEQSVKRSDTKGDDKHFGVISMNEDGRCAFLDEENLCRIQRNLGAQALSQVCANYPRRANQLGEQLEYSLSLSCPEAARLTLLDDQAMRFVQTDIDPALEDNISALGKGLNNKTGLMILNDLRALIIGILQSRDLTIDARLILIGLLLEDFEAAMQAPPTSAGQQQQATLQRYVALLGQPKSLQDDIDQLQPDLVLKMRLVTALIGNIPTSAHNTRFRNILKEAADGLSFQDERPATDNERIACHAQAYARYYAPYFDHHAHILENYLVHHVFHSLFPFARTTLIAQYREMVCNYLVVTTLLLGQAAFHKKMTAELAVGTIQSYTRFAGHYTHFKETIERVFGEQNLVDVSALFAVLANFRGSSMKSEPPAADSPLA